MLRSLFYMFFFTSCFLGCKTIQKGESVSAISSNGDDVMIVSYNNVGRSERVSIDVEAWNFIGSNLFEKPDGSDIRSKEVKGMRISMKQPVNYLLIRYFKEDGSTLRDVVLDGLNIDVDDVVRSKYIDDQPKWLEDALRKYSIKNGGLSLASAYRSQARMIFLEPNKVPLFFKDGSRFYLQYFGLSPAPTTNGSRLGERVLVTEYGVNLSKDALSKYNEIQDQINDLGSESDEILDGIEALEKFDPNSAKLPELRERLELIIKDNEKLTNQKKELFN